MKKLQIYHTVVTSLVVAAVIVAALALFYVKNQVAIDYTIFVLRSANFALRMDALYDRLPDVPMEMNPRGTVGDPLYIQWGVMTNSPELEDVVEVVAPYWEYEFGIKQKFIRLAGFIPLSGSDAFHILGQACCVNRIFIINYGYVNPYSHVYRRDSLLPTIVHEIGHTQGICGQPTEVMEAANQVATIEVLAAMANHNNAYAIKPLVGELRDFALGYVRTAARGQGREDWYERFVKTFIYETDEEQSRYDKSQRYWSDKQLELDRILYAYSQRPWYRLSEALAKPDLRTPESFWRYPNKEHTIKVDDLAYFLSHLDRMERMANEN